MIKMNNGLLTLPLDMLEYNVFIKNISILALGRYGGNSFLGPRILSFKLYNECVYQTKHETIFYFMNFWD